MIRKLITPFAAAATLGGFVAATTVPAEETTPQSPQAQHKMGEPGGMMSMMGQMSPDHMRQMTEMIENCNRIMSTHKGPDTEQAPDHRG